ncbi:MAG: hypothetical protein ACREVS_06115 [Burkholderiales bacterium]
MILIPIHLTSLPFLPLSVAARSPRTAKEAATLVRELNAAESRRREDDDRALEDRRRLLAETDRQIRESPSTTTAASWAKAIAKVQGLPPFTGGARR